jgi:predicted PurR-regulated permease PerM
MRGHVDADTVRSPEVLAEWTQRAGGFLIGPMIGVANGLVGAIINLFLMVFAIYYLFRDGAGLVEWLEKMLPLDAVQSDEILRHTREMIDASVYGVIVLAILQGTLGGLAFLVLGLPNPFVWGVVMIILSTIPVTGSFLIWAPAAIYLAFTGEWGRAAGLTAWGMVVIGLVDNFLRPFVMGQKTRLHELLLFFSVLGGLAAFGIAGVVLGPVIVAITLGLIDVIRLSDRPPDAIRREPGLAEQSAQISEEAGDNHQQPEEARVGDRERSIGRPG